MTTPFSGALRCMGSNLQLSHLYLNATPTTLSLGSLPQVFNFAPALYTASPLLVPLIGSDYTTISFKLPEDSNTYYLNGVVANSTINITTHAYGPDYTVLTGTWWSITMQLGNNQLNIMCLGAYAGAAYNSQSIFMNGETASGNVDLCPNTYPSKYSGSYWLLC